MATRLFHTPGKRRRPLLLACLIGGWCLAQAMGAPGVESDDQLAFNAALRGFEMQMWERAEKDLGDFLNQFPQSTNRIEAIQRRAYAHAELLLARRDFSGAIEGFSHFHRDYPESPRAAWAVVQEASARLQSGDAAGAVGALEQTPGPFASALQAGSPEAVVLRGLMLRSQAWQVLDQPIKAAASLEIAKPFAKAPEEEFSRLQALALAREKASPTNAAAAAQEAADLAAREPSLAPQRPSATAFTADLLTRLGQRDASADWWSRNLAATIPVEFQRQATLQLAKLRLEVGDPAGARQRLESFLGAQPTDPEAPLLRLQLAQVLFRLYQTARDQTNRAEASGLLTIAGAQYLQILTSSPPVEILGPAALGRGWCLWEDRDGPGATNRLGEAETNFLTAAAVLSPGVDQARAWFKAGDCQLARREASAAIASFRKITTPPLGDGLPPDLVEAAWSQIESSASVLKDRNAVLQAREKLLTINPRSESSLRGTLMAGQVLIQLGDPEAAHALLASFAELVPDSRFRPEIELAMATADLRARRWTNAIGELDHWIDANPKHPDLPQAMWNRAWASAQARRMTNAAAEFTRLAARFPSSPNATAAQLWLADDYFNRREYDRAEWVCNLVLTNDANRGRTEWYRAKFLAAESARKLENWRNAGLLLIDLLNDKEMPASLLPNAYFALGEWHLSRPPDADKPVEAAYDNALEAFRKAQSYTNSPLSPAALGWMANCYLQKAGRATNFFPQAIELYSQTLNLTNADNRVRADAAFGLAQSTQMWAVRLAAAGMTNLAGSLRLSAVHQLLDFVHGKLLRPGDTLDPSAVEKVGRSAGELLEELGRWSEVAGLYVWLAGELPAQRAAWESKAAAAGRRPSHD